MYARQLRLSRFFISKIKGFYPQSVNSATLNFAFGLYFADETNKYQMYG